MIPAPAGVGRNIRSAAGDKNAGSIPLFDVGPVCIITLVENAIVFWKANSITVNPAALNCRCRRYCSVQTYELTFS